MTPHGTNTSGVNTPLLLIILDGLALNPSSRGNAVEAANTPTLDRLMQTCPHTTLVTFGPRVGLPEGQMGNSEVGHLNIGGGRIVQQNLTRINAAVYSGALAERPALVELCRSLKTGSGALHLIGLVSRGGVYSSLAHLQALLRTVTALGVKKIYVHAITDGRDRPPTASIDELAELENTIAEIRSAPGAPEIGIASLIGRYFAMDRDGRWDRVEKAYRLFTEGAGESFSSVADALRAQHAAGHTDEFIPPHIASDSSFSRSPVVQDGDGLLFFNFRADRMREIVSAFTSASPTFEKFERLKTPRLVSVCTLTEYEEHLPVQILFPPHNVKNHLGETLAAAGLKQVRIAETEKYAHVTYFFNGGAEEPCANEERILVPSPRDVATYDLKPEMSARDVTQKIIEKLRENITDVYIINYANCDMVGHTGSFAAAVNAVETVDACLGQVLATLAEYGGTAVITADHGNADQMIDYQSGGPHTFHTTYPVPLIIAGPAATSLTLRAGGALCDIAPTICKLLGVTIPAEMTGSPLF